MRQLLLALSLALAGSALAVSSPLAAEQNGDQKQRFAYAFEGTNFVARNLVTGATRVCVPAPAAARAAAAALVPLGIQHLALDDASGKRLAIYHTVTDAWYDAAKAVPKGRFKPSAWIVVAIYFCGMAVMAWWFIRKQKSADDYFRGGGRIPWYVAGVSIFATMLSSITFIAIPTQTFLSDWRYFPLVICTIMIIPLVTRCYLPFFRKLKVTSAYEYLERRFNLGTRLFGSAAFIVFMVSRVAVVTLLPALALNAATGVSVDVCILVCGAATILYCSLGGLEAVVWSDFVQGIVLLGGAIAMLVTLVLKTDGGLAGAWALAEPAGKTAMWDFRWDLAEPCLWVILVQGLVMNLCSYTSDQCVIQRYMAVKDEAAARRSIWFNGTLCLVASVIFYALGTALWTHYKCHPELLDVAMPKADSVLPTFMATELPPWLAGLVIAAVFAATISTLSANLSSASTAVVADFVRRFRPDMPGARQIRWGQACTVVCGILGMASALVLARMETHALFDNFQELISILTAGLMALFFMGIFMPRVKGIAAVSGLAANYVVCFAFKYVPPSSPRLHPFLVGGIGFVACVAVAWVLSFVLREKGRDLAGLTLRTAGDANPS